MIILDKSIGRGIIFLIKSLIDILLIKRWIIVVHAEQEILIDLQLIMILKVRRPSILINQVEVPDQVIQFVVALLKHAQIIHIPPESEPYYDIDG